MTALRNVPASVRQRLLNRARSDRRPFNELLQYFAMERFLYRLSQSAHADRFVLKGALMLQLEVAVKLGMLNSRMKDFYDIWLLSRQFDFDGSELAEGIRRTFERRGTALPVAIEAFTQPFIDSTQIQWMAFRSRLQQDHVPASFTDIVAAMADFLSPIVAAVSSRQPVPNHWTASGPWT